MRKKKILSSLLIISMMICLMPMKMFMATEPTTQTVKLQIIPDKTTAHPGDEITYTIKMGPVQNLAAIQLKLEVPEAEGLSFVNLTDDELDVLEPALKRKLSISRQGGASFVNDSKQLITYGGNYSSTSETELMTFKCTVNNDATVGEKTVLFSESNLADTTIPEPQSIPVDVSDLRSTVNITIPPTGVSLDNHAITVEEGAANQTLTATIAPPGATGTLVWSTSNGSVASVTDNNDNTATVTISGVGTANITVTIQGTDYSDTCTVNVTEYVCPHTNKTETAAKAATCTEAGNNKYYYCEDCHKYLKADGTTETTLEAETISALGHQYGSFQPDNDTTHSRVCTRNSEHTESENHTFGAATYIWSAGNSTCTASHTCTVCNKEVSETVDAEPSTTPATCTEAEKTTYTATFTKPGFTAQTKDGVETSDPLGHDWGAPTYTWSDDNSTCTATRVCTRDASHKEEETVEAAVTTTATCTEAGTTTYTATFRNEVFNDDSAAIAAGQPGRTKEEHADALEHDFVWVVTQEATDDQLGVEQNECSRCGDVSETRQYAKEDTSPSKWPDGSYISYEVTQASATTTLGDKNVEIILQDPLGIFESEYVIEIVSITEDLGADYDANISIEKAYKANVILKNKTTGEQISGQLPGKVRLLLEIPDDPNDPNDDWDHWETRVQRIEAGEDEPYTERIEYRAYKDDGTFRVVEKGAELEDGETLRVFVAVWTDHFSDYAVIDPEDQVNPNINKNEANENKEQINKKTVDNTKKTGESLNEVYFAGVLLSAAILVLYLALKKRREA